MDRSGSTVELIETDYFGGIGTREYIDEWTIGLNIFDIWRGKEMKDEKKVEFTQKWIEDAVKKLQEKEDIYESDMEKIKYLRIGSDFANSYIIEMSTSTPPDPFYDTDGGDEW